MSGSKDNDSHKVLNKPVNPLALNLHYSKSVPLNGKIFIMYRHFWKVIFWISSKYIIVTLLKYQIKNVFLNLWISFPAFIHRVKKPYLNNNHRLLSSIEPSIQMVVQCLPAVSRHTKRTTQSSRGCTCPICRPVNLLTL